MQPVEFKEQTSVVRGDHLKNGDGTPMGNLPAYIGHGQVVSCWRGSFVDRLRFLFTGRIWLSLMAKGIPPTSVNTVSPFQ